MRRLTTAVTYTAIAAALLAAGCGGGSEQTADLPEIQVDTNLVVNGSFEEWDGFMPVGWEMRTWSGEGHKDVNFFGKNSEWHMDGEHSYFLRSIVNTRKWMVLYQKFPVRPGYEVHFGGYVKAEGVTKTEGQDDNACIYIIFYDADGNRVNDRYWADAWTDRRIGNSPWSLNEADIEVPEKARSVELGLINTMTGYAFFDLVGLRLVPVLPWESRDTKFIEFLWQPERPFTDEEMDKEAGMIEGIAKEAGIREIEGDRIKYYLYPSEERFMEITGRARYRQYVNWGKKTLHTVNAFDDHDMIHLILYDLGTPPMGVAKGLVFYFRSKYHGWDIHNAAKQDLMNKRLPALYRSIPKKVFEKTDLSVTIPAWGSFTTWLIDKYGMQKALALFTQTNEMDEAGPFSARFKAIYGKDFTEMDQDWRWWLLRYEVDAAADTIF